MSLATEFKEFVLRGNVVDLAVGVAIGAAFGKIVTAFTNDIITPLVGLPGTTDLVNYKAVLHGQTFNIGDLVNTIFLTVITAFVIFLAVVKPINFLIARAKKQEVDSAPTTKECPECLTQVPLAAKRCSACTSVLPEAS